MKNRQLMAPRAICSLAVAVALTACGERAPEGATVLSASRLYVSPDAPPVDDAAVLIVDGRIAAAGPAKGVAARGAKRFAGCDGGTVTAGFQNSHVHFTEAKFADAGKKPAAELGAAMTDMLNRFGFTTVVDTASNLANTVSLRERVERGEVPGPRILTAGFALYPKDGIPIYLRDLPPDELAMLSQPATVEDALAEVQANLDGGANATKLFLMTPQGGGRYAFMQPDIALAAADETHRRGLPVLAHPTDIEGINLAIEANVDILVHTTIGEGKTAWDAALIEQMRAKNIAVVPTLQLFPYELKRMGLPGRVVELATGDAVEQVRAYSKAGGQVLFGTDVGYMADYDPTEEYRLMAKALSPMEILASLTTAPAARWKEESQRGRVAAGLVADLVVLGADPAADPANFARVRCTIRAGQIVHAERTAE
ncbi:MAG TPA: amidohydrolase family protein [Steroidobacteraceae bacterium]|nr:amidohydrolase family protein [Steroidobacteraceae bacterium]